MVKFNRILFTILIFVLVTTLIGCNKGEMGVHLMTPLENLTQDQNHLVHSSVPDPDAPVSVLPSSTPSGEPSPEPTDTLDPTAEDTLTLDFKPFVPQEKVVCFTFDDGPNSYTNKILDKLEGTDDKVTFFVVGKRLTYQNYAPYAKRAIEQGHEIGFHSYDHIDKYTALSLEELQNQIDKTNKILAGLGGDPISIIRPVEGVYNNKTNYGYPCILWNVDTEDWRVNSSIKNGKDYDTAVTDLANSIVKQAKSGSIILMHDMYKCSADAFIKAYDILSSQGYKFVTVSEMLGITGKDASGYAFRSSSIAYYYGVKCS
ncbi:MAG: polysaccharide deacetylase family protein [Clostridia bacterium]|nr:polysaccharide deacetylase family protein [Clostridia bacterium]